jgi:hypothetical protein
MGKVGVPVDRVGRSKGSEKIGFGVEVGFGVGAPKDWDGQESSFSVSRHGRKKGAEPRSFR